MYKTVQKLTEEEQLTLEQLFNEKEDPTKKDDENFQ